MQVWLTRIHNIYMDNELKHGQVNYLDLHYNHIEYIGQNHWFQHDIIWEFPQWLIIVLANGDSKHFQFPSSWIKIKYNIWSHTDELSSSLRLLFVVSLLTGECLISCVHGWLSSSLSLMGSIASLFVWIIYPMKITRKGFFLWMITYRIWPFDTCR
jgi:hypothetical protein